MNGTEEFLKSMQATMPEPHTFGWFHLLFIALVIAGTVLLCIYGKNAKSKTFKIIVGVCWGAIVILELYKQIFYASLHIDGDVITWQYAIGQFPFQLCSMPLYLLPFVVFMKDGKVKDSIMAFLSTFVMFGGLVTFIYPEQVFIDMIGINIQTMVHHGLQIVLGIYFMVYNRKKLNWMYFVKGIITFAVVVAIAELMNIIVYNAISQDFFNMFYISPYHRCILPLFGDIIYPTVNYPMFPVLLLAYLVGFPGVAAVMFAIQYYLIKGITKLYNKKHASHVALGAGDTQNIEIKPELENELKEETELSENNTEENQQVGE